MHANALVPSMFLSLLSMLVWPLGSVTAQDHDHPHGASSDHHHGAGESSEVWTIRDVLALKQNESFARAARPRIATPGVSGAGAMKFRVAVTSEQLPKKVFEANKFDGKRKRQILDCAHGGFAYDHRAGKGQVYWFLQGAGILRIEQDRSKIELLKTDPEMVRYNMHNATFFEHAGEGMIAWPANSGAKVFVTDVDGNLRFMIGRPTVGAYRKGAGYAPTDTAYVDGKLWVTDGYASKFVMSYDLEKLKWTGTIFGGRTRKPEPGKFGTNHGITIYKGLIYISGRFFARIHSYRPDTEFVGMFPLPDGSKPCDFEFFVSGGKLYGVAASLNKARGSEDKGAAIYIVDMSNHQIVSTIRPKDELGLAKFTHLHNVFPTVDDGVVTLFCQAWNGGDFAVLKQVVGEGGGAAGKSGR